MNKFLILMFLTSVLFSQEVIFNKQYSDLPFDIEIENSGIYGIASFDVVNSAVSFTSFTKSGIFEFKNGKYSQSNTSLKRGSDFVMEKVANISKLEKATSRIEKKEFRLIRKNYFGKESILYDTGGEANGSSIEKITISVPNKNELIIKSNIDKLKNEMHFNFHANLACANLVGIDKVGNVFVVVEKFISEIPLRIEREVYTISKNGNIISRLLLPNIKYLYTLKDLQIDAEGNLYHLLTYLDRVEIVKWSNLTTSTKEIIKYSDEYYNAEIHFNSYTTTDEIVSSFSKKIANIQSGVSRTRALKIADSYVVHQYVCNSSNLAPNDTKAKDGDIVRTPKWLVEGVNARIPYKWGGFNTLAQFDVGLTKGKYAGDINTKGVSSYAVGVDCSGYVSRCWQLSYHSSTRNMPGITTQYSSWSDLKPGDAVHKIGHVRLFVKHNINGSLKIVESTGRGWGVSYYSYSYSDLNDYSPRYYNKMEKNYNDKQPTLLSAKLVSNDSIALQWNCDTSNVLGYRVYNSEDGKTWSLILDENNCKITHILVEKNSSINYFRISSVANDSPNFSESDWSNVLGVGNYHSKQKVLIVDGFERESGSWRGAGHQFVSKYGNALNKLDIDFTSVKNSELQSGAFKLEDYNYLFWILGDESTVDETFNSVEQGLVEAYLHQGGNLFVSGSEIGWDLDHKGSEKDKDFYSNYLKANYLSDDAGKPSEAKGIINTALADCNLHIGQTYEEDYPDEIEAQNGSKLCMKYANGKGAGIQYTGVFGSSTITSNLLYIAFPLETTADDDDFDTVISKTIDFFNANITRVTNKPEVVNEFKLEQNYPNPFNPSTTIKYSIPASTRGEITNVKLVIYDVLGQVIATLVNEEKKTGIYEVQFDASGLTSGVYFYKLAVKNYTNTKKMMLLR